jgi:hypothetical protein
LVRDFPFEIPPTVVAGFMNDSILFPGSNKAVPVSRKALDELRLLRIELIWQP